MPSISWYLGRLSTMSAAEMRYRGGSLLNHTIRRYSAGKLVEEQVSARVLRGFSPSLRKSIAEHSRLTTLSHGTRESFEELYPGRTRRLIQYAEQGCRHVVSYFDLDKCELGEQINWHKDYKLNVVAPVKYGPQMDFRDPDIVGNTNYVWELNRHQHLIGIAKAYHLTGDERFAKECVNQITSWSESNPHLLGINWNSGLELGMRLISWLWVARFITGSSSADEDWWDRFLVSVWQHAQFIHRNYSAHSSANNHLIGEAAGVFLVSVCFPQFAEAREWQEKSLHILRREACKQISPDGVSREQTIAYQTFTTMLLVLSGVMAKRASLDFGSEYWSRIKASCQFLSNLMDCSGNVPSIGDATDSRAVHLDEEESYPPCKSLVAIGAILFDDELMRSKSGAFPEAAFWLFGRAGYKQFAEVPQHFGQRSALFRDGGYAILRRGHDCDDELSLVFDAGPLGYLSIAAHGHADALSFTLSAYGKNFFIDPGTYVYFVDPRWRNYFKGTAAHNTVRVDNEDQAQTGGDFIWLKHYSAHIDKWESTDSVDRVEGSHDGYSRLRDPVLCHRAISLHKTSGEIELVDTIEAKGAHVIEQFFHLSADCKLHRVSGSSWRIENNGRALAVEFDSAISVEVFEGSTAPILGWESLGYGRKRPSPTIRTTCVSTGVCTLRTYIRVPSVVSTSSGSGIQI